MPPVETVLREVGRGFDLRWFTPSIAVQDFLHDPTSAENLSRPGGRGLFLIHAFMDKVYFNDAGNEITMIHRRGFPAETNDMDTRLPRRDNVDGVERIEVIG